MTERQLMAYHELERRKCKRSFAYFVDNYVHMWLKEGGDSIVFKLWPFQKRAANTFQKKKKVIVLKARQMGMSWLAMAYVVWCALYKTNFHIYITSIGLKEVNEQMERIRFIWYNLPEFMKEEVHLGGRGLKDNDSLMEFSNGSAVHAVASTKSGGHGAAPGLYILDEFSRKENDVMSWRAIKPSLGRNSQVLIISTSNGLNNLFADLWFDATSGSNEFTPVFFSATEHPEYTKEYLEEQRRDFAGDLQGYKEAFPLVAEDAFLASSKSVFDIERIRDWKQYIRDNGIEPRVGKIEDFPLPDKKENLRFVEDESDHLLLWKEPVPGHFYTAGVDLAQGLVQGDWSVTVILDATTDELVAMYRAKIAPENYSYPVLQLVKYYNNAWTVIEVNKNAEVLVNDIKSQYPFLYTRPHREKITDKPTWVVGFVASHMSKPRVITQLRRAFSDEEKPLKIYSDTVLDEMSAFEETDDKKLEAASGKHDDCVIALALAVEGKTTMPTQRSSTGRGEGKAEENIFKMGGKKRSWRSL